MRFWLTEVALYLLLALAVWRGGRPERIVAIVFTTAFLLGAAIDEIRGQIQFLIFDPTYFSIECVVFSALLPVALRANRWWPLCACALQLIILTGHIAKLMNVPGMAGFYWGMTTIPTYFQFVTLLLGILAHWQRTKRIGPYRDWQ